MKTVKTVLVLLFAVALLLGAVSCKGESAYDIAVRNGFSGTEVEWLESLKGATGSDGKGESAYDIAVRNGFSGTEPEWLDSLKGADGLDGKSYPEPEFHPGDIIVKELNGIEVSKDGKNIDMVINYKVTLEAIRKVPDEERMTLEWKASHNNYTYKYEYKVRIECQRVQGTDDKLPSVGFYLLPCQYCYDFYSLRNYGGTFDSKGMYVTEGVDYFLLPVSELVFQYAIL